MGTLNQQNVTSLRPEDLILIMQGGVEKRMTVQSIIDYINTQISNMVTAQQAADAAAIMQLQIDDINLQVAEKADATAITALQSALANKQDKLNIPQPVIADPAAITTANVLGITVAVGAGTQGLQATVLKIVQELRAAGIIIPSTP